MYLWLSVWFDPVHLLHPARLSHTWNQEKKNVLLVNKIRFQRRIFLEKLNLWLQGCYYFI